MTTLSLIIQQLESYCLQNSDILLLGVFGSYAKNSATFKSDLDICIALKSPLNENQKIDISIQLSLLLKKEVDLVDLNGIQGVILKEALTTAIWVKKDTQTFAQILKRMLFDQADFQPYYERMLKAKRERFLKK